MNKCACGCGQLTSGKYAQRHNLRGKGRPDHPSWKDGYQSFRKAIKAKISHQIEIHHFTPDQLVVCQDRAYHKLLHYRQKAYETCGHANWRKCRYCKKYDDPNNLSVIRRGNGRTETYHKNCATSYQSGRCKREDV